MKPALTLVPQQPEQPEVIRANSLGAATRPCDAHRAYVLSRDWSRVMIAADKREPVRINIAKPWRWA